MEKSNLGGVRTHELKEHPAPFAELAARRRNAEVRLNDRDYRPGDTLTIREYDPRAGRCTQAFVTCYVRSVTTAKDWGGMLEGLLDPRAAILGLDFPEELRPAKPAPSTDPRDSWDGKPVLR